MNRTTPLIKVTGRASDLTKPPAPVYPFQSFLEIQRLMQKLNLTPADCLQLLAEFLSDLDCQIEQHEAEGDGLPFPPL